MKEFAKQSTVTRKGFNLKPKHYFYMRKKLILSCGVPQAYKYIRDSFEVKT